MALLVATAAASFGVNISNASYANKSFSVASQETSPGGVFFKPDGLKMYVIGSSSNSVLQYTLSTAGDVSTASYDSVSLDVSTQETTPTGLFFKPDGTTLYVIGDNTDDVFQYTLSTPWDLSSASYDSVSVAVQGNSADVFFKSDGKKMYVLVAASTVHQWSLSTAWDLSTATNDSVSFLISEETNTCTGMAFSNTGTKMMIVGTTNDTIYQYTLSTAWDLSTASYDEVSLSVSSQDGTPQGLFFNNAGKFYMIGASNDTVYQYST